MEDLLTTRDRVLAQDFDDPWTVHLWNALYPPGTPVVYYPILPPIPSVEPVETRTRSQAWELGHGAPVVLIEGRTGGVLLDHLVVRQKVELDRDLVALAASLKPRELGAVLICAEHEHEQAALLARHPHRVRQACFVYGPHKTGARRLLELGIADRARTSVDEPTGAQIALTNLGFRIAALPDQILEQLNAEEKARLVAGKGKDLDHERFFELRLVFPAYRTNKKGHRKFCGRKSSLGLNITDRLERKKTP